MGFIRISGHILEFIISKNTIATYNKPENGLLLTQPQQFQQMLGQVLLVPRLHHDHSPCTQQSAGYKISILRKAYALQHYLQIIVYMHIVDLFMHVHSC